MRLKDLTLEQLEKAKANIEKNKEFDSETLLISAFIWDDSNEGHEYWQNIACKGGENVGY